ncbi:MAG: hypothetical protein IPM14_08905 [bacterium]|nr:hypothetical protein [bacterium]
MKQNIHHLYYLFYPRGFISLCKSGRIITALLLFNATALAQEQKPSEEFTVGAPVKNTLLTNSNMRIRYEATGFNTIWHRADNDTKEPLEIYNLIAYNDKNEFEYIYHYSSAYYSKWEAEQNQENPERVGFKHYDYNNPSTTFGDTATWRGKKCWSTEGLTSPACSLMYGPHYRQDKLYKRWYQNYDRYDLKYTPRFRMALDNHGYASINEDVCVIKVVFRYKNPNDSLHYDSTFIARTLKVGDFDTNGNFDDFYLHPNPLSGWYEYYPGFILPEKFSLMEGSSLAVNFIDWESFTGIQFWVDWLRTDTLCTLYIDYAEVYDNDGWNAFMYDSLTAAQTIQNIKSYADSFKTMGWDNIIYWGGTDEPYSIDCYTPIRVVDELIRSVQAPPLVVHFDPSWWHTLDVNGEDEIEMFYNIAKPEKIILGMYPASPNWPAIRYQDFEWLRFNFQRTSAVDSSFWFKAQTFGLRTNYPNNPPEWCIWRKPKTPELTSMIMLSLAHGSNGIIFEWFDSFVQYINHCSSDVYIECLVNEDGNPEINDQDTLYNTVKDKLVPRLKGTLGKTLMNLDYSGNYLQYRYQIPTHSIRILKCNTQSHKVRMLKSGFMVYLAT